jgi:cytochrome c553
MPRGCLHQELSLMRRTVLVYGLLVLAVTSVLTAARHLWPYPALRAAPRPVAHQERAGRAGWRYWAWRSAALLPLLVVGGFVVAASGIIPIKASTGHWPITVWLLHFAMRRSVATHTLGLSTPPLAEPALVLQGAGHYETGCRPCHGSPGLPPPRIAQRMTPHPPYLPPVIPAWEPDELFYIVKHGVKFTGMPAWPAPQRDDEVWAMVAFLRTLPDLDAAAYRRLVHGEATASGTGAPLHESLGPEQVPHAVTASCGRCHGVDGRGRGIGAFPKLAGQRSPYLLAALQAFARGERYSGIMEPIAAGLSLEEMRQLALYYGAGAHGTARRRTRPGARRTTGGCRHDTRAATLCRRRPQRFSGGAAVPQ